MGSTPASSSLRVYMSDILLLTTTLVSLTFRAYRQGVTPYANQNESLGYIKDTGVRGTSRASRSRWIDDATQERILKTHSINSFFPNTSVADDAVRVISAITPAPSTHENSDVDEAAAATVAAEAAPPANIVADPLLILAQHLTLEEKLSTAINWFSLVSNCLTYFLRPSQVLYTFLFTNGDLVLFVTSYSNRYQHLYSTASPPSCPSPDDTVQSLLHHPQRPDALIRREFVAPPPGPADQNLKSVVGGNTHYPHLHGAAEDPVTVCVPPPSRSPFPANGHGGPRYRESAPQHSSQQKGIGAAATDNAAATAAYAYTPVSFKNPSSPFGWQLRRLRHYASRCVAFAQTQLLWLLVLNAVLTFTLFIFHLHHLFFGLGTLFGYLAAVASVYLCGMEAGCIVVRLRQSQGRGRRGGDSSGADASDNNEDGAAAASAATKTTAPNSRRSPLSAQLITSGGEVEDWDPCSGVHGPHWAFVGEHLSAAACSLLYVWMLLDEGDVLWSTHVDLMRWYVCSCALMTLSLLKCLRVVL